MRFRVLLLFPVGEIVTLLFSKELLKRFTLNLSSVLKMTFQYVYFQKLPTLQELKQPGTGHWKSFLMVASEKK